VSPDSVDDGIAARIDGMTVRFPDLDGRNLAGAEWRLPADLPPGRTLVLLPFHQWHQRVVDAWIAWAAEAAPATPVLEVPMLGGRWRPARPLIDGGMARAIGDQDVLERTVTTNGQVGLVRSAFDLAGTDEVVAVVASPDGTVHGWVTGRPESGSSVLHAALAP
jgi:hypothetical protein